MLCLDNTKRSDYITCPRKYQLRNIRGIQSRHGSPALRYGIGWHGAMEGFYTEIAHHGWTAHPDALRKGAEKAQAEYLKETTKYLFNNEDYRNFPNMMKGYLAYIDHFRHDEGIMKVIEPEKVFKIKITPTAYELSKFPLIQPFYFTGKIDLEVELNGRSWIMEHKTTSRPINMQVNALHRSPQVIGYNYAAKATSLLKEIPDGSLIVIHQITAYKSRTTNTYGEPKFDFARSPQIFSEEDLANWRFSFCADAYQIQLDTAYNSFPMRHHSCYTYGPCMYINLCEQNRKEGEEILQDFEVDGEIWDVTKDEEKLVVIDESDVDRWDAVQRRILP